MTKNSAATAAELDEIEGHLRAPSQDHFEGVQSHRAADAIAALRRERDEAQRDSRALERTHQAIPLEFCLDPPDGGDVKPWEAAERMAKALSEARAANAQMAAALRFYADPANWRDGSFSHDKPGVLTHHPNSVLRDHGAKARAALPASTSPEKERDTVRAVAYWRQKFENERRVTEALAREIKDLKALPASPSPEPEPFGADVGRERLDVPASHDPSGKHHTHAGNVHPAYAPPGLREWPDGCRKRNSCARNFGCMYGCETHWNRKTSELQAEIERALAAKGGDHDR